MGQVWSISMAYLTAQGITALHLICDELKNNVPPFICITGIGYRENSKYLSFREYLTANINTYFPSAEMKPVPKNDGRLVISNLKLVEPVVTADRAAVAESALSNKQRSLESVAQT